ncbi:hypothetical protein ACFYWX_08120 [Streptomyces sp. NPDC002888]|uniref:hypothetical protein n=1 Tax=Streptomyces sp. NPDC002888 TaxID=3364668 RepID=UPI0036C8EC09
MYAVKVVLLPLPAPGFPDGPGPPAAVPGDQRLDAISRCIRAAPQPGIAHVTLAPWGGRLVGMTFVEAASLDEAVVRARYGWRQWLDIPGLLPDWMLSDCRPDRYLSAHAHTPATGRWLA